MNLIGIHHITAICGDPQTNIDFYSGVLGLRLAKVTVNFDDPGSYHLYYGDELARPGTCLTFFAWPQGTQGKTGNAHATAIRFSVPPGSIGWWIDRLPESSALPDLQGRPRVTCSDPDGIQLEFVEADDDRSPWIGYGIEAFNAIRGFHSVVLTVNRLQSSVRVLEAMGFSQLPDSTMTYALASMAPGNAVSFVISDERASPGVGTIHHVAFATPDEASQEEASRGLREIGLNPTPVQERQYFRSIYYREPSGVLYEIATAGPGFAIDESPDSLGERLCLPSWFESRRPEIERALPRILTPSHRNIP
jgi:glyoxalase family protein